MTVSAERGDRPAVRLREHGRLVPPAADDVLVSVSVGPAGDAIALWMSPGDLHAARGQPVGVDPPGLPLFPARVVAQTASDRTVTTIVGPGLPSCQVQPLPDGRIVAVAGRGGAATVYDADGKALRHGHVGDGIKHVLSTPAGNVWIGYFDEGVYGRDPVAHHGIVRFTADLKPDWMYPFDTEIGQVHDCYTLNVDAETAWSCFYSGFPIVRISERELTTWRTNLRGATALVASADTCAVIMGTQRPRAVIGHLTDGRLESTGERLVEVPGPLDRSSRLRLVARGPDLHVFNQTRWYRIGLDDLV